MNNLPVRKQNRLQNYNYSNKGAYFITICTKDKKCILSKIQHQCKNDTTVGCDILGAPKIKLSNYGLIVKNQIDEMNNFYDNINVDVYTIMPNHLHLIIRITNENGAPRTSLPTNSVLSNFVGTLKRMTNKSIGKSIWQRGFYDHIIRDEEDYITKYKYIQENPLKWADDKYHFSTEDVTMQALGEE